MIHSQDVSCDLTRFNSCLRQIRMCDNENLAEKHIMELNFRVCQGKWCQ